MRGMMVMSNIAAALRKIKKAKADGSAGAEPTPREGGQSPKKFAQPQPRPEPKPMRGQSTGTRQPARDIDRQRGESASDAEAIREHNRQRRAANAARRGK